MPSRPAHGKVDGGGTWWVCVNGAEHDVRAAVDIVGSLRAKAALFDVTHIDVTPPQLAELCAAVTAHSAAIPLVASLRGQCYVDQRAYMLAAACGAVFLDSTHQRLHVPHEGAAGAVDRMQIERQRGLAAGSLAHAAGRWVDTREARELGLIDGVRSCATLLRTSNLGELVAASKRAPPLGLAVGQARCPSAQVVGQSPAGAATSSPRLTPTPAAVPAPPAPPTIEQSMAELRRRGYMR